MNTPRTDKRRANGIGFYSCATVPAHLAEELEIERNAFEETLRGFYQALSLPWGDQRALQMIADLRKPKDIPTAQNLKSRHEETLDRFPGAIEEQLRQVIVAQIGCNPESIELHSSLREDIGADSLDVINLQIMCEIEFGIAIPDEDIDLLIAGNAQDKRLAGTLSVKQVLDYLTKRLEDQAKDRSL